MDVFQAVKTMLAVRSYRRESIPPDVVERILEAGRLTGSSMNTQQWNFVVIRDNETLKQLGELVSTGSYISDAALAVAVVVPDSPTGYIDGARASQDMMLAAWGEGIGSNWVGNANTADIKKLLNAPADRMVLNIIPFGYPAQEIGQDLAKDRKPLADVAHNEKFGQPYRSG